MAERTLVQRLIDDEPPTPGRPFDISVATQSVLDYLQILMNTRQGSVSARPDFGLPDFNDMASEFPAAVPAIARAIKQQIDTFEPRLRNVVVRHVPDPDRPLTLAYRIRAELDLPETDDAITFETVFGSDGSVRIR
jgi:type VI secretion system protein